MYWVVVLIFWFRIVNCYRNNSQNFEPKIIKGFDVGIHQYSYATFLHFDNTKPSSCGASLIMVQAVLTAAHCLDEIRYRRGRVHAYFGATVPKDARAVRRVIDYTVHPKYNEKSGMGNLGIGFLENRVPLMYEIKKIPLAYETPADDTVLTAVGWGKQQLKKFPDFSKSRSLKATKQRVISAKDCVKLTGLSTQALCTISVKGHFYKDDAGDGLIMTKPSHFIVGVMSFVANDVAIHTNVYSNRKWIIETCHSLFTRNCKG